MANYEVLADFDPVEQTIKIQLDNDGFRYALAQKGHRAEGTVISTRELTRAVETTTDNNY